MNDSSEEKNLDDKKAAFEELKRLILGDEQQSIEEIRHHVFDKKQRTEDLADILPESVSSASKDPERLSNAMSNVIHGSINKLINTDPQSFADALFPVMGPAIRRSINETLKSFIQSLNQVLEQNMSVQGMKWRFESWKKGVPYAELVLKHTLVYRVDEVFLIQPGSGLLIGHAAHPEAVTEDSDAVSAMLSAIQDFVRDSFAEDKKSELDTVELGEHTLWVVTGPNATLACAIRGIAPLTMRQKLQEVLEQIHINYKEELESFDGDNAGLELLNEDLSVCLQAERSKEINEKEKKPFFSPPLIIVLLVIFLTICFFVWKNIDFSNRLENLKAELQLRPGIILYESTEINGDPALNLLVDPLAEPISDLPKKFEFKKDEIIFKQTAYQSLEPEIVLRRVKKVLNAPESVNFIEKENTLYLAGVAPINWINSIEPVLRSITGYDAINISQLNPDYSAIEQQARKKLKLPNSVQAKFDGTRLFLFGDAPAEWLLWYQEKTPAIEQVKEINNDELAVEKNSLKKWLITNLKIPDTVKFDIKDKKLNLKGDASYIWLTQLEIENHKNPWIESINKEKVIIIEQVELEEIKQYINKTSIYFSNVTDAVTGSDTLILSLATKIKRLEELGLILGIDISVDLIGHTDGLGSIKKNSALASKRSLWMQQQLIKRNISSEILNIKISDVQLNNKMNLVDRRVALFVNIKSK